MAEQRAWWRRAVIYQIYIRSFADADGDGIGDIGGIRSRLPYLRALGVDALWITPWYPSPMADGGYDVADHRSVDPTLGTVTDAAAMIAAAHDAGLRVLLDLVPNHTSDQHPWFQAAQASPAGSRERGRYLFRDGRGPLGAEPPNDWESAFGGSAWTRTMSDGVPAAGQWYLHSFAPEQPDLDWANPEVREEFESILRQWFDLGVDGFRVDVAMGLVKHPDLPDLGSADTAGRAAQRADHPQWDQDGVHDIYRAWRKIADGYPDPKVFVGEVHSASMERLARYVRPDELQAAFNLAFLKSAWDVGALRAVIDAALSAHSAVGATPTWVFSNHDETRHVTRFGRRDTDVPLTPRQGPEVTDLALGTRRARSAALLMLGLPGRASIYQGEELGLPEVEDLPAEALQDPVWTRTRGRVRGRDGCRVPLPWTGGEAPFGFGPLGSVAWLPQPRDWSRYGVEAQEADVGSMLMLYRGALRIRREHPGFAAETFRWIAAPTGVLAFERDSGVRCVVNLAGEPMPLPSGRKTLLASEPLEGDVLPAGTAIWDAAGGHDR